jgi:cardiolipin synthase (CMP-forming)
MKLAQLPNAITLSRIALVPVMIVALNNHDYRLALVLFVVAGLSDGLDGFLAKRFHLQSRLGGILDPAADKILLVSAYVMLTVLGHIPFWLMLTVAFRDLLIVGGYVVYTAHSGPVQMRPSALSKLNTVVQLTLVALILAQQSLGFTAPFAVETLIGLVAVTTLASGAHYLWTWGVMHDIEPAAGENAPVRRRGRRKA